MLKKVDKLVDYFFHFLKENPLAATIFIYGLIVSAVFFNFYLEPNERFWGDSYYYLSIAKQISEGILFENGINEAFSKINSHWPIGYSFLIGVIELIFGIGVFWSSMLLNISMISLIVGILHYSFYPFGWVYCSFLLGGIFIDIFSLILSATSFIGILFIFALLLRKIYYKVNFKLCYLLLGLAVGTLFLIRYVGGFALGVLFIFPIYYHNRFRKVLPNFLIVIITATLIIGWYLVMNYYSGDQLVGNRSFGLRDPAMLTKEFFVNNLMLLNLPININFYEIKWVFITFLIQFLLLLCFLRKSRWIPQYSRPSKKVWPIFLFIGIFYYITLILAVYLINRPAPFLFRLTAPGFFLLFIALINFLHFNKPELFKGFAKFAIVVFAGSFFLNCPLKIFYRYTILEREIKTYSENVKHLKNKYAVLSEKKTMIIGGDNKILYLLENTTRSDVSSIIKNGGQKHLDLASINNLLAKYQSVYLELSQPDSELYRKLKSSNYQLDPVYNQEKFEIIRLEKGLANG